MKAVVGTRYGSPEVLSLQELDKPVIKDDEVLVRVCATSINPYDWHFMRGLPYVARAMATGLLKPKYSVLGSDMAGRVEAVGNAVQRFHPGDAVFGCVDSGGLAEYIRVPEQRLGPKPTTLSFAQAASVPLAGLTALQGLRDVGHVQSGQKLLIIGASGGVGTFAVQIARTFGAHVTGVCSTRNIELVRSLGADDVIDYTQHDFTRTGHTYDVIFQLAGTHSPSECIRALTPDGTLVLSSGDSSGRWIGPIARILQAMAMAPFVKQKLRPFIMKPTLPDLQILTELIEAGKLTPVIDRTYALGEAPAAISYLEQGHARGKVVIDVGGELAM